MITETDANGRSRESSCRCGVKFVWLDHARTGRSAPIEQEGYHAPPSEMGLVIPNFEAGTYIVPGTGQRRNLGPPYYVNHWWVCPEREEWRERILRQVAADRRTAEGPRSA